MTFSPLHHEPLAPRTTLKLGGAAKWFVEGKDRATIVDALRFAREHDERLLILGGGSNLVVADEGVDGLVVHMATRGREFEDRGDYVLLTVEAGEVWQDVVDTALERDLAGFECLTGIPGTAGATPIQNVGAYGQEVSDTIDAVEVLERATGHITWISNEHCRFAYRDSDFKRQPERFIVLSLRFRLQKQGAPTIRYPELQRALAVKSNTPTLREVADVVHRLRSDKSMVIREGDPNQRSAGSFFQNPIVTEAAAERVMQTALALGLVKDVREVPCFAAANGQRKLAAGWLIERAGFAKGTRRGAVGLSSKHALALVHHGGGTTRELLGFAAEIQQAVRVRFGVELEVEPVCW